MSDKLTLFHRATSDVYDSPCDVALVPVFDKNNSAAGFIGSAWGEHEVSNCLHSMVCSPEQVQQQLESWGLHFVPSPLPVSSNS